LNLVSTQRNKWAYFFDGDDTGKVHKRVRNERNEFFEIYQVEVMKKL